MCIYLFLFREIRELSLGVYSINRTRTTNERSQLVAAPLRNQAKTHFLCVFYVTI